jgi:hypothetical protein
MRARGGGAEGRSDHKLQPLESKPPNAGCLPSCSGPSTTDRALLISIPQPRRARKEKRLGFRLAPRYISSTRQLRNGKSVVTALSSSMSHMLLTHKLPTMALPAT